MTEKKAHKGGKEEEMKPKHYPYSGRIKKQPEEQITFEISKLQVILSQLSDNLNYFYSKVK
ncbi:Uncharacterised protein [Streptococcus suis]|nr:Uncharacterised protein [Streptococcus suis]CYV98758.1 Uncharacterised protein [Streptococcus suis]